MIRSKLCWDETGRAGGFTRLDLVVAFFCVLMLLGIIVLSSVKLTQRARVMQCAANLKRLGIGMSMYAAANEDQLPYAVLKYDENRYTTWDSLVYRYVPGGTQTNKQGEKVLLAEGVLRCPADLIGKSGRGSDAQTGRRTYSMPWHDMTRSNWPPAPENSTGIGLWWSDTKEGQSEMAATSLLPLSEHIPSIRTTMILAPGSTLLLTEKAQAYNHPFSFGAAKIRNIGEHLDIRVISREDYHSGKINYLMIDGGVKTLFPEETIGLKGGKNIWTIRPDD